MKYDIAAFPHSRIPNNIHEYGMTLRDYFAGQALPKAMESTFDCEGYHPDSENWHKDAAKLSYKIADAMLAERENK